jgi:hypothetical protein
MVGLVLSFLAYPAIPIAAQEKPPNDTPEQEFPRALSAVQVNRPVELDPGFTLKSVQHSAAPCQWGHISKFDN